MARAWTDEQKARQAALVQRWRPWERSTGARTPEGKRISSMNVLVGNANKAKELAQAQEELKAAELKVMKLSRGKINPWMDSIMREFKCYG
jgi:hypothetical protein